MLNYLIVGINGIIGILTGMLKNQETLIKILVLVCSGTSTNKQQTSNHAPHGYVVEGKHGT